MRLSIDNDAADLLGIYTTERKRGEFISELIRNHHRTVTEKATLDDLAREIVDLKMQIRKMEEGK